MPRIFSPGGVGRGALANVTPPTGSNNSASMRSTSAPAGLGPKAYLQRAGDDIKALNALRVSPETYHFAMDQRDPGATEKVNREKRLESDVSRCLAGVLSAKVKGGKNSVSPGELRQARQDRAKLHSMLRKDLRATDHGPLRDRHYTMMHLDARVRLRDDGLWGLGKNPSASHHTTASDYLETARKDWQTIQSLGVNAKTYRSALTPGYRPNLTAQQATDKIQRRVRLENDMGRNLSGILSLAATKGESPMSTRVLQQARQLRAQLHQAQLADYRQTLNPTNMGAPCLNNPRQGWVGTRRVPPPCSLSARSTQLAADAGIRAADNGLWGL